TAEYLTPLRLLPALNAFEALALMRQSIRSHPRL
ncbi:MAG: hypothetical protein ACI9OF_002922, partial [Saprospiraceae bacterium]